MVKKGEVQLQVQTEYAGRPAPRITTTISNKGQVVNKVERTLDRGITTAEEQSRVERAINRQHVEIVGILEKQPLEAIIGPSVETPPPEANVGQSTESPPPVQEISGDSMEDGHARLMQIPGVQKVYCLDNDGSFFADSGSEEFYHLFGPVFNNLRELMNVFSRIPGPSYVREAGVCEVEKDRLYFASTGTECYFIVIHRADVTTDYERDIRHALKIGSPFW